jgi:hypothetical protein
MNGINNGIGYVFGQKTSSKNNKYTSVKPQKNIYQSTNSPVRVDKPVERETRINDIRNYQPTKPENVNNYSVPATRSNNDLRNTQPTSPKANVEYSTPVRNTPEPKVNTYTPSERNYTKPQRQEPKRQPQRQEPTRQPQRQEPTRQTQRQNNPVKSRIETPRRQEPSRNISPSMQRSGQRISNGSKSGR